MKIQNIDNVDTLFKVINRCKGKVELVSEEGDRINLKSKLAQYLTLANVFSNGYIRELDLVVSDPEDVDILLNFMLYGD